MSSPLVKKGGISGTEFQNNEGIPEPQKFGGKMKFTRRDWIWLTICTLTALYAIASVVQSNRLLQQVRDLKVFTIKVQAIDQPTGRPTDDITVGIKPDIIDGQIMKLWSSGARGPGAVIEEFIGTGPFAGNASVSSKGYEQRTVSFDSSNNNLSVPLSRKP